MRSIFETWKSLQQGSNEVLRAGLEALTSQPERDAFEVSDNCAGVYLVSLFGMPVYAGEAGDLASRVKQQFSSRSTFYKNYLGYTGNDLAPQYEISNFKVRCLTTKIGRKELEEFAIAELGLMLNKAMGRLDGPIEAEQNTRKPWAGIQAAAPHLLSEGSRRFLSGAGVAWNDYSPPRAPGVYRVQRKGRGIIYIGETSDLKRRFYNHSSHSRGSALRRHIGTELLGLDFERPKTLSKNDESKVNAFLSQCTVFGESLKIGRYELEDRLIKEQQPLLNRKGKKKD